MKEKDEIKDSLFNYSKNNILFKLLNSKIIEKNDDNELLINDIGNEEYEKKKITKK